MWKVEYEQGSWVASWNGDYLPNTYQSREEAMEALLDHLTEWYGEEWSNQQQVEQEDGKV